MLRCPNIEVTSPRHRWLGTTGPSKEQNPALITVLLGDEPEDKASSTPRDEDVTSRIRRESKELKPTAFFFEKKEGGNWETVPVEKIGTEPYFVDGILAANFMNNVRCCESNEEQRAYLKAAGIAIDRQFIEA